MSTDSPTEKRVVLRTQDTRNLQDLFEGLVSFGRQLRETFEPVAKWIKDHQQEIRAFAKLMETEAGRDLLFRELFGKDEPAARLLLSRGWYPLRGDPGYFSWVTKLCDNYPERIDEEICKAVELHLADVEERLAHRFPKRAAIITAAFEAHKTGAYALSIPTLHAQAEGLCFDETQAMLYTKTPNSSKVSEALQKAAPSLEWIDRFVLFGLLDETSPLTRKCRFDEPAVGAEQANRHRVLHGQSTDYATRENSCRVISYVAYLCDVVPHLKEANIAKKLDLLRASAAVSSP